VLATAAGLPPSGWIGSEAPPEGGELISNCEDQRKEDRKLFLLRRPSHDALLVEEHVDEKPVSLGLGVVAVTSTSEIPIVTAGGRTYDVPMVGRTSHRGFFGGGTQMAGTIWMP